MERKFEEQNTKMLACVKKVYKNRDSIFVNDLEEVIKKDSYVNRYDEWLLRQIVIGYLSMALEDEETVKQDIKDLFYSICCLIEDRTIEEAIEESHKYDLSI